MKSNLEHLMECNIKQMDFISFLVDLLRMPQWYIRMCKKESELLNLIEQITDYQMANALKDILKPEEKESYLFDMYLRKLDAVVQALLAGVSADKILRTVNNKTGLWISWNS